MQRYVEFVVVLIEKRVRYMGYSFPVGSAGLATGAVSSGRLRQRIVLLHRDRNRLSRPNSETGSRASARN